jgi:hypothetical protein
MTKLEKALYHTRVALTIAFALGLVAIPCAQAEVLALPQTDNGYSYCQGGLCVWGSGALPTPGVHQVPQPSSEDREAAAKHEHEWAERCKPTIGYDAYGVARYTYAKTGCEFGNGR